MEHTNELDGPDGPGRNIGKSCLPSLSWVPNCFEVTIHPAWTLAPGQDFREWP